MSKKNKGTYLFALFYRPGNSVKQLIRSGHGHVEALAVAAFFGLIQSSRLLRSTSEELLMHFLIGGVCGVFGLYLFGWLVRNFSRWFGASAEQRAVRIALGLGIVPWMLLFMTLSLLLYAGVSPESIAEYFTLVVGIFIYGFCILLLSLSAALQLSVIKTFLCMGISFLFSVFPLTLLAQLIASFIDKRPF